MEFKASISDPKSNIVTKTITATSKEAAQKVLEKDGSLIISLKQITKKKKWYQWSSPLRQKDILMITKRIGDMTGHGFSVVDALRTIELQTHQPTLKEVVETLRHKVEMGNSLADALKTYPRYFSNVYVSLVAVGEKSGTLPKIFKYLEKQEKQLYELKKKALSAMAYPAVILSLMLVIGIGMVIFLIPFLRDIFDDFTAELPLPTRMLMGTEAFISSYWWILLIGIISTVTLTKLLFRSKSFVKAWHSLLLKIPFLGSLIKSYNAARIIRTFATLNRTGVPMLESLRILETVPNNQAYRISLQTIREDVDKGAIFSVAIEKHPKLYSPLVIESVKLGESTGNLSDSLHYLAEIFEQEVKETLTTLTKVIQPLLLILVGLMVAGFALSVIVPLQRIPTLMNNR